MDRGVLELEIFLIFFRYIYEKETGINYVRNSIFYNRRIINLIY